MTRALALAVVGAIWLAHSAAQEPRAVSCDQLLQPPREVNGRKVGPSSCLSQESTIQMDGRGFVRLDVGLDGTVDGYLPTTGDHKGYLTNAPDLVFLQATDAGPRVFAVATYERDKGAAMTVVFPRDAGAWNGKMWLTAHGRGRSFNEGNLRPWDRNLDPADPLRDLDKYDRLMLAKGYALVKTYRSTPAAPPDVPRTPSQGPAEITARLEDGTVVEYAAFNDSANYLKDFGDVARKILERRLGREPRRTYLYGHSAGARIGRGINYTSGLNRRRDGRPAFDAFLLDDPAAGTWLPVVMKDGRDILLTTETEKAGFLPQLEVWHQMYNNIWPVQRAAYLSSSYLANKRQNARILGEKGLTAKYRFYEVRGISHSGGETLADGRQAGAPDARTVRGGVEGEIQILDMSKLMSAFIDLVDRWADQGVAPPPSRSDWAPLGDTNHDGTVDRPALAFPEVACPLGVYYPYPTTTAGTTSFAAFSGEGLEPLDRNNVFIDMNRNGVWDFRETPTAAWQRLGLLQKGEPLTRARYEACVERAAGELRREGFFPGETAASYIREARTAPLPPATR
jgi:hypothetical protein